MQAYLIDTSVLVRFLSEDDSLHKAISMAVDRVFGDGAAICFTPQVARETWSVLTRPRDVGGFGLTPSETSRLIDTAHKASIMWRIRRRYTIAGEYWWCRIKFLGSRHTTHTTLPQCLHMASRVS